MTLQALKDFFKTEVGWTDSISICNIDRNAERAVCFYPSRVPRAKIHTVGGRDNRTYGLLPVTVLLRWGRNAAAAAQKAEELYNFFDEKTFCSQEKRVFIISRYDSAIPLDTDEGGVYEYSLEFDVYFEK